jgi:hypothetical protein
MNSKQRSETLEQNGLIRKTAVVKMHYELYTVHRIRFDDAVAIVAWWFLLNKDYTARIISTGSDLLKLDVDDRREFNVPEILLNYKKAFLN